MTENIKSKVTEVAKSALPWQKGVAWWIVLLEGIVLLGLGIYMFFARTWTFMLLGWIITISLVVSGGLSLYLSLKAPEKSRIQQWTMIHGLVGLGFGVIVAVLLLFQILPSAGLVILGLGCLAYAGVGLYILIDKNLTSLRNISMIDTIFYLLIGSLIMLHILGFGTLKTTVDLLKLILMAAGIILIFWGFIIRNESIKRV